MKANISEGLSAVIEAIKSGNFVTYEIPDTPSEIKELRKKFRMTQAQFADFLDISVDALKSWETGRRHPRRETLEKVNQIKKLLENV
jgi:DNA-binding transcriptional regulator YiaG